MACRRCGGARRLLSGLLGWGKVAARQGIEERALIEKRRQICRECEKVELSKDGEPQRCRVCGCFLYAKTQLIDSHCPEGRW